MASHRIFTSGTRNALHATTALAMLFVGVAAHAQTAAAAEPQATHPSGEGEQAPAAVAPGDGALPASDQNLPTATVDDIVVTGTLIRGIAPAGASTIGLSQKDIAATGATTTSQMLSNVPQVASFNSTPAVGGLSGAGSVNRINLRALPGTGGGSSTLILLDGHRMPGMGVLQTIPDPDAIAPGAIERVEIVPDGGSSTYGADAVGGVVNFISLRRFDGLKTDGRIGFADNYKQGDVNVTVGKAWDQASVYLSYNFESHDPLYGRDRNFVKRRDYVANLPLDLSCNPGNIGIGSTIYALPSLTAGTGNRCDVSDNRTFFPSEIRHSVFAGISFGNGGPVTFDLRGFYTHRVDKSVAASTDGSVIITPGSPFYRSVGGADASAPQSVYYDFATVATPHQRIQLDAWQIAPTMSASLGKDWQLRTLMTYGVGKNAIDNNASDAGGLQNLVSAGLFNPYDLGSATNAQYISGLSDYGEYGYGRNEQLDARITVDGPLFTLPGGQVRVAAGGEYLYEKYTVVDFNGSRKMAPPPASANRNVAAIFGEIQVPVVGAGNSFTGVHALNVSVAGRYDHYSDFGGTFNPRFGITYEPTSWISLRGSWSKSYQAPSLADSAQAAGSSIIAFPFVIFAAPNVTPQPGQAQVFLSGGGANLRPQKAKIYSLGGEIKPPFIEGLKLGATYYNVKFSDLIGIPPVYSPSVFFALYKDAYTLNPTSEQVKSFAAQAIGGANAVAPYTISNGQVYSIADGRRSNQSAVNTSGIDFSADFTHPTGFGSVFANFNGNYVLTRDEQTKAGAAITDTVGLFPRTIFGTTVGTTVGGLTAQATLNHLGGSDLTPVPQTLNQDRVSSFNVLNLFFSYDLKATGALKGTIVSLSINNVLDQDPPVYRQANGYVTGFTLGRLVQVGLSKTF